MFPLVDILHEINRSLLPKKYYFRETNYSDFVGKI
jgi:hypothetical protein